MDIETVKAQVRRDIERHMDENLIGQQTPEQIAATQANLEDWLSVRWSALLGRRVKVTLDIAERRARIGFA